MLPAVPEQLGEFLKFVRKRAGWTQTQVGEKTGYTKYPISRFEHGKEVPSRAFLEQIKGLFDLTLEERTQLEMLYEQALVERTGEFSLKNLPCFTAEMPTTHSFFGRFHDLSTLTQWLLADPCRVVGIFGGGGMGKSLLAAKVTEAVRDQFSAVLWFSLRDAPPITDLFHICLQCFPPTPYYNPKATIGELTQQVLSHFRQRRCLFVLDNLESILQSNDPSGYYRPGYEAYGELIQRIGESEHQSCLLLTSREKPAQFDRLENTAVRPYSLSGLQTAETSPFYQNNDLTETEQWPHLVAVYAGNPLCLKIAVAAIRHTYGRNIATFLQHAPTVLDDIRQVLDEQMTRLSPLEKELFLWLAIEREAVSLNVLQANLVKPASRREFHEAITALQRRSLVETTNEGHFILQNVIAEYLTDYLVEEIGREIYSGTINLFASHALVKAQAKEYIQESQKRLFVYPIAQKLWNTHLEKPQLMEHLWQLLALLKAKPAWRNSYAAGNLLNLLAQLGYEPKGWDFSGLAIWQADLRCLNLRGVNLSRASIKKCQFIEDFEMITSIALTSNFQLLATGTANGWIHLWQLSTTQQLFSFQAHESWIHSLNFDSKGHILVSSSNDTQVRVWNTENGRCLHTLSHPSWVSNAAISPNGRQVATTNGNVIFLWELPATQLQYTLEMPGSVSSLAFSPDGHTLGAGNRDNNAYLWNIPTRQYRTLSGHTNIVWSTIFSPDGCLVATCGHDSLVYIWDVDAISQHHILTHQSKVDYLAFHPAGHLLATASQEQVIYLWDVHTGQLLRQLSIYPTLPGPIRFTQDRLLIGSESGKVEIWDFFTGQRVLSLQGYTNRVLTIDFSPDGQTLASGSSDQLVKVWNIETGQCRTSFSGHTHRIWGIDFHPNGRTIASSGFDKTARLWDIHTGPQENGVLSLNGFVLSPLALMD